MGSGGRRGAGMSAVTPALAMLCAQIEQLTRKSGQVVDAAAMRVISRDGLVALGPPTRQSPNGACRLLQAADHWIALNLARPDDWDLLPAWLETTQAMHSWEDIEDAVRERIAGALIERASLL